VTSGGMGAMDAHDGKMQKGKTETITQPMNDIRVWSLPFRKARHL